MIFKKLAGKNALLHSNRITTRKGLTLSYASLFLAILIFITGTVSWFTVHDTAKIDSTNLKFNSSTGLRVNDGEDLTNHIKFEDFRLEEASSVDGRNFYFPTTGTFTSNTNEMVFREGNVGDKNVKYAYKDFKLSGEVGTTVYVKSYTIKIGDETFNGATELLYDSNNVPTGQVTHKDCPVRVALIADSADTPTVFDPTALVDQYVNDYDAVAYADQNGVPTTLSTTAKSFSDYYFITGAPLYTIGSEDITATLVVWLEGTGENWEAYAGKDISVDIELESNFADFRTVTFVDNTKGDDGSNTHWITNKAPSGADILLIMTYKDTKAGGNTKSVVMTNMGKNSDGLTYWQAPIPNYITTDIAFYRYDPLSEIIYNAWYTNKNVMDQINPAINNKDWLTKGDLENTRQKSDGSVMLEYTALRGNRYGSTENAKERLSPCVGYWNLDGTSSASAKSGKTDIGTASGTTILNTSFHMGDYQSTYDGYDLYAYFNNNTYLQIPRTGYGYYKLENKGIESGLSIKNFVLRKSNSDDVTVTLPSTFSITSGHWYNFTMDSATSAKTS